MTLLIVKQYEMSSFPLFPCASIVFNLVSINKTNQLSLVEFPFSRQTGRQANQYMSQRIFCENSRTKIH